MLKRTKPIAGMTFGVSVKGKPILVGALGQALSGVPATTAMHVRTGNMSESIMTTLLLQMVDHRKISLDDTVAKWYPDFPEADQVTVRMLASSTSGYGDYVTSDAWSDKFEADPFQRWTATELLDIAKTLPPLFPPGTSWAFSDTNFLLLGQILQQDGGKPYPSLARTTILDPLHMDQTRYSTTAAIPEPVLHAYSNERGKFEEVTYWSPSWAPNMGNGTSDVNDMLTWSRALGTGQVLTKRSHRLQTGDQNVGLGPLTEKTHYGMGAVITNDWIFTNPQVDGYNSVVAYLPERQVAVTVAQQYIPHAGDDRACRYAGIGFNRLAESIAHTCARCREPMLPAGDLKGTDGHDRRSRSSVTCNRLARQANDRGISPLVRAPRSRSSRKSGWAIEIIAFARSGIDFPLRLTMPYSVTDVHHVAAGCGDDIARRQVQHDPTPPHTGTFVGRRHADERLPAVRRVARADELELTAGSADVAVSVRLARRLTLEIHLGRVVDRHQPVVLHDQVRQVGHLDGLAREVGVVVHRVVERLRTEPEAAHDLAGLHVLRRSVHHAGPVQVDDPVGEHLGVDAEVAYAGLLEERAHGVRHRADADLQTRAVVDLRRDQTRDRAIGVGRRDARQLRQRVAAALDDVVDLALVQTVLDAVDIRERPGRSRRSTILARDATAPCQRFAAPKLKNPVAVGRSGPDHHDLGRIDEPAVVVGDLAEVARDVVLSAGVAFACRS